MEYQKIVEAIESVLEAADESVIDKIPELSKEYARACREVNERLDECDLFLRADHYAEALRLADAPPRLLDSCGILQIERLSEWKNVCVMVETAESPEPINKEVMNRLISVLDSGSLPLVRELRRLMLIKAPLIQRLEILHQLFELEPMNACWIASIPPLEQAVAEDLSERFDLLKNKKETLTEAMDLYKQAENIKWQNRPEDLFHKFKTWQRNMTLQFALIDLRKIAENSEPVLKEVTESPDDLEGNLHKLEFSIAQWSKIIKDNNVPEKIIPFDIKENIRPVFEMYDKICYQYETIKNNWDKINSFAEEFRKESNQYIISLQEIEKSWYELSAMAESAQLELPEPIKIFYEQEFTKARKRKSRNRLLLWGSIGTGVLLLILIAVAVWITSK